MFRNGRILIMRGDMPLQLAPELIHRISLRTWLRQPEQRTIELGSEALPLGGALPRRLVQSQRDRAPRICLAHEIEAGLEVRWLHVRAPQEDAMPGTEMHGAKQERRKTGKRRSTVSSSPRSPVWAGNRWSRRTMAPFVVPGVGLSPQKKSGAACSVTPWLSCAAAGYGH
jgi:hypothetical protein